MSDSYNDPFNDERSKSSTCSWSGTGGAGGGAGGAGSWGGGIGAAAWNPRTVSYPVLRKNSRGFLRRDAHGFLFSGTDGCSMAPNLIVRLGAFPEGDTHDHYFCLLFRLSGNLLNLVTSGSGVQRWAYALPGEVAPGDYTLIARWQGGHHDYGKINSVRLLLFGIDFGSVTLPLSGYSEVAKLSVFMDGTVSVNDLKGSLGGNAKFFS